MEDYKGVIINNLKAVGTLTPAEQRSRFKNAQYSLNTPYDVVIKNSVLGLNGYNCIEIGLAVGVQPPRSVTIEDCDFTGTLTNNAILVFGTQDNAVINIKRCHFKQVSNMLRISNRTNASGVVINIVDCTVDACDEDPTWHAIFLWENYTDKNKEELDANNRFAPDKIRINIDNLKVLQDGEYVPINVETMADVTNTGNPGQLFVWCQDYMSGADFVPVFDPAKLPTVYIDGVKVPDGETAPSVFGGAGGVIEEGEEF